MTVHVVKSKPIKKAHALIKQSTVENKHSLAKTGLQTVLWTGLGTLALVGAHHLGRRQYHESARLSDYVKGVIQTYQRLANTKSVDDRIGKKDHRQNDNQNVNQSVNQSNRQNDKQRITTACLSDVVWVSGVGDLKTNAFAAVGIDITRNIIWQTALSERVHDIVVQPQPSGSQVEAMRHVAVMGRRPSEYFWVLDTATGAILYDIQAKAGRHFYGHACYSLAGDLLYVTENDTATFAGKIGIYDVATGYQKIGEYDSAGIGPHEIVMHPDGKTLVIANGGIKTERASREELNIDTMQPSLVYLDCLTGEVVEQIYPDNPQMSVRHLAMHSNGTVAIGIQFQGERYLSVPLVLTHKRGDTELTPLEIADESGKGWHRFHHYIASIAVNSQKNQVCVTSPIGGCAAVFDLQSKEMVGEIALPDCAGVATYPNANDENYNNSNKNYNNKNFEDAGSPSFIVSDGQGYLTQIDIQTSITDFNQAIQSQKTQHSLAFDNHLQCL